MQRFSITTLVLAVVLVFAQPVGAEKPNCDSDPSHPSCKGDEPAVSPGFTCSWLERGVHWESDDDLIDDRAEGFPGWFSFTLDRDHPDACIDVVTSEAGRWYVTVTGPGPNWMAIVPRDAVGPGDSCGGRQRMHANIYELWELPALFDTRFNAIPEATVNACSGDDLTGVGEFAEWLDFNNNDIVDDGEAVMKTMPAVVHPLALQVSTSGLRKRGAEVTVCVDLPPTYGDC